MNSSCDQCGRAAMFVLPTGQHLCLECQRKLQAIAAQNHNQLTAMENQLMGWAEAVAGVEPGTLPRRDMIRPAAPTGGGVTFHNIQINNSIVGAVNTGTIQQLDVAMDHVRLQGHPHVADALKQLTQAVLDHAQITKEQRDALIEHLAFVAKEAQTPPQKRQRAVGKAVLGALRTGLTVTAELAAIWAAVEPSLTGLF